MTEARRQSTPDTGGSPNPIRSTRRTIARAVGGYVGLVVVPGILAVVAIRLWGGAGPVAGQAANAEPDPQSWLYRLLLAVAVIVLASQLIGAVAVRLGQPKVIGEMAAGILLGPTILGATAPDVQRWLFPAEVIPPLEVLANFGVIFFMFFVGLELPLDAMRRRRSAAVVLGHAGIAIPFLAGVVLGVTVLDRFRPDGVHPVVFAPFCGLALSITAFPVLARILAERGLHRTPIGALGLACAGIGDLTAWCLLTVIIAERRSGSAADVVVTVVLALAFALLMTLVVRPGLARFLARDRAAAGTVAAITLLALLLLSAWATELIGVHAIFGAFVAGLVMPRDSPVVREFADRLEGLTIWLLLPLFFATVGLKTSFGAIGGAGIWLIALAVVVVAMTTKMGSIAAGGRFLGMDRHDSASLAVMMNCRGLTEIVVLNIGLSLHIIDADLFAVLVLMALVTTALTGPLLGLLWRDGKPRGRLAPHRTDHGIRP
ncbi:hypothetical protein ALI144C_06155 [Actinosynnema sp. ALI-1.44]|uniref:cation:proton antiporter domain-containing protein n=1 Tax=Actinosynnema sp. ALI-1.44 TaxID=1933779 RepID=UPI00097C7A49|nr:cation:proton antiporter [Actinosynnema sp. ALI-1.44]ONI88614.1 hypothetical protein ALI144C_06155 [Actinosynnema sp. ALI-1.44]